MIFLVSVGCSTTELWRTRGGRGHTTRIGCDVTHVLPELQTQ